MSKSGTSNHIEAYARNGPHLKNSKLRKPSMAGVLAEFVREPQARPVCTERDRRIFVQGSVPTQNSGCRRNSRISLVFGVLSRNRAREDSNLQPDRYKRSMLSEKLNEFERFRARSLTFACAF